MVLAGLGKQSLKWKSSHNWLVILLIDLVKFNVKRMMNLKLSPAITLRNTK